MGHFGKGKAVDSDITGAYSLGLDRYDCVFNTVPACVLTSQQLRTLRPGCPMIELASRPGGFTRSDCQAAGLQYISGAAQPGRTAPLAAGENIARALLRHLRTPS